MGRRENSAEGQVQGERGSQHACWKVRKGESHQNVG